MVGLPSVRRYEAAGFRAWPAERVSYDGSWQWRLTPGHPTRRPNCVVPLDPGDTRDIAGRISRAEKQFQAAGVSFVVKETPLCPPELLDYLRGSGWKAEGESSVQTVHLGDEVAPTTLEIIPSHDINLFVDACQQVQGDVAAPQEAMRQLFGRLEPEAGMFILSDGNGHARAVTLCVHDGNLAGLQQVAVAKGERRRGYGFEMTAAALKWAKLRGATTAWLQVETANEPAIQLYRKFGFSEIYRYRYWHRETVE